MLTNILTGIYIAFNNSYYIWFSFKDDNYVIKIFISLGFLTQIKYFTNFKAIQSVYGENNFKQQKSVEDKFVFWNN